MVSKNCVAFLAYLRDDTSKVLSIEFVSIVHEFLDVFPVDLPGMTPDRDIDFYIDLESGTRPISIPLYRMAPTELSELKAQLPELFEYRQLNKVTINNKYPIPPIHDLFDQLQGEMQCPLKKGNGVESADSALMHASVAGVPTVKHLKRNRFYAMKGREEQEKFADVVIGSTLSFVNPLLALTFEILPEVLYDPIVVSTPLGKNVRTNRVYKDCPIVVSGKANVVADVFSRMSMGSTANIEDGTKEMVNDVHTLARLGVQMTMSAHFIHVKSTYRVEDYARLYIDEIVESSIQKLEDMFRACVIDFRDSRKRPLEFDVIDQVYLKISPMKGVMRFGRKGKLSSRDVGPYKILQRVGEMAYELTLPTELYSAHIFFHVFILKKFLGDPALILPIEGLGVHEDMSYEEVRIEILERQFKWIRNKEIATLKALWRNHLVEGATWEAEGIWDPATLMFSAPEVSLPTLQSKFPYFSVLCCYCLFVDSNYDMI
ncbi:uncharacterized protein [Solanum lycopersicum]|uniref:uncharacterized protein n=1 Tax=Solanum lycopersicum TaxID=4081 RepID=UPI00374A98D8